MTKGFETLKNAYLAQQKKSLKSEQIILINLEHEKEELFNLGSKRVISNQNLFDSYGVKELFEQIKSEGILGSDVKINEGIPFCLNDDKLKSQIKNILDWPGIKMDEAKNQTCRWVDKNSIISLSWDYEFYEERGDNRASSLEKHLTIGAREGELYLRFPTGYKKYESIRVKKSNLIEALLHGLTQAQHVPEWDDTGHVIY